MKKFFTVLAASSVFLYSYADTADPSDPETWIVTANNYQYSMTITTALVFDTEESRDVTDKIAAFVGNDCRGVAQPITYIPQSDRYLAYLLVYSNNVSGDSITLYMYDNSAGKITEVAEKPVFYSNATYGNADDPYLSRTTYDITFVIEANDSPVTGAQVYLDGNDTKTTDSNGQAIFYDVFPSDSIYYKVIASGYENYENSLSLIDTSIVRTVDMALESYHVIFGITNGAIPVQDAVVTLSGYGLKTSDVFGEVSFPNVIVQDSLEYTVSDEGFFGSSGTISVTDTAVYKKVTLSKRTHNLSFKITDANGALKDVSISCIMNNEDEANEFMENNFPVNFTSTGNSAWTVDSVSPFQGRYCLKSGKIFDNQVSKLNFEKYTREGKISFYTKVSSEAGNDSLIFYIDGSRITGWSGDVSWRLFSSDVSRGDHTFRWIYKKDGSNSYGGDCAWIDYVETPSADSVVVTSNTDDTGDASFYNLNHNKKIYYSIYSPDYEENNDSIEAICADTSISLSLTPVYKIYFTVTSGNESGNIEVSEATIQLTGMGRYDTTDAFGEAVFSRVSINDSIEYKVTADGYDDVTGILAVTDGDITEQVTLTLKPELHASNLITPNGDNKNDYWEIYNVERYKEFTVEIFSSTGEKIYSTTDYENNKWDGKVNGNKIPDGVYYYIMTSPDKTIFFKGILNLIH